MAAVLRTLTPAAVVLAMEANFAQWWISYKQVPQADVHDEPEMLWLAGGIPIVWSNCVARTSFAPTTPSHAIDAKIAAALAYFAARSVGMQWHVTPSSRPENLGQRLIAHGLKDLGDEPGMAADLDELPAVEPPAGLVVRRVSDATLLYQWATVNGETYGYADSMRQAQFEAYAHCGYDEDTPLQRYLALLDGAPVAIASLFLAAGVAGIYDVAAVPRVRGRGVGAAITLAPLLAARARGYHVAVLQASTLGEPLYRRLGFSEYCRFGLYGWQPQSQ